MSDQLPQFDMRAIAGVGGVILGYFLAVVAIGVAQLFGWLPL